MANVPFEIGVKLKEVGYWNPRCTYNSCYNDPCYVTVSKKFYGDGVVAPWEEIVPAPTYAEVFNWFIEKKSIVITLDPFFTFSYQSHIAYTWKVSYIDVDNDGDMKVVTENDVWTSGKYYGGSFDSIADDAIEFAVTLIKKEKDGNN